MTNYRVENFSMDSLYGEFDFYCFNFGAHEEDNVLVMKSHVQASVPLVRVQSACFTAEIFRSKDCDCHEQLETSLKDINEKGGYFIYLLQDGRGAGIFTKVKGLKMTQELGIDTAEAYDRQGVKRDPRQYDKVVEVLRYFNVDTVNLLTNNPRKIKGLEDGGIKVNRMPLEIEPTEFSQAYLQSKKDKLGHMFQRYIK